MNLELKMVANRIQSAYDLRTTFLQFVQLKQLGGLLMLCPLRKHHVPNGRRKCLDWRAGVRGKNAKAERARREPALRCSANQAKPYVRPSKLSNDNLLQ